MELDNSVIFLITITESTSSLIDMQFITDLARTRSNHGSVK
jgi:hypothetical protein